MRAFSDWILATRPWAFSASVIPVAAVAAWAGLQRGGFDWINAALSVFVIVLLHAGADVLSDCRDHERGVDFPGAPNGVAWIRDGRFAVPTLRRYACALLAAGALLGVLVLLRSSWSLAWIGGAGVLIAVGYSFLKYRACGDLAVFLAFVALPAAGVGMAAAGRFLPASLLVALPPGLLTLGILIANNVRDVATDARAGCRTLPMVAGPRAAAALYLVEEFAPYLLVAAFLTTGLTPYAAIGTFLTLPLAVRNVAALRRGDLATLDRSSAQLQLLFGILYVAAFPVSRLDFWWQLAAASVVTGGLSVRFASRDVCRNVVLEVSAAVALAAVLWGVFWIGDRVSQILFTFARGQIDAIYALRADQSPLLIGALLLFLIGPAEELFWRGVVQHRLSARLGPNGGFVLATCAYTLVHVWSGNFMLVGAAAVCGATWGLCYRFFPRHLPALVLSHALWDVLAFVVFPIGPGRG